MSQLSKDELELLNNLMKKMATAPVAAPQAAQNTGPGQAAAPAPQAVTPVYPGVQAIPIPLGGVAAPPTNKRTLAKNLVAKKLYSTDWGHAYIEDLAHGTNKTTGGLEVGMIYWSHRDGKWSKKTQIFDGNSKFSWKEILSLPTGVPLPPSPDFNLTIPSGTKVTSTPAKAATTKKAIKGNAKSKTCLQCGKPNKAINTGFSTLYWCPVCEK